MIPIRIKKGWFIRTSFILSSARNTEGLYWLMVYLFVEIDPRVPLHQFIKSLKGRSSRILREEFPWLKSRIPSLWTRSYFCCTIGHISEDTIRRYIEEQKHV